MLEIVVAGGWVMLPILLCSTIALGIILERAWTLRKKSVMPPEVVEQVWRWARQRELDSRHIDALRAGSPLGRVLAAALASRNRPREIMKEHVEDTGRHVVHDLERFLNSLGTIAGVTPLLGLLGTVLGMIQVFSTILTEGVGDATRLAGGISEALVTTAAGLTVAIPAYMFYRYFRGRVAELVVRMEEQAIALIEALSERRANSTAREAAPRRYSA